MTDDPNDALYPIDPAEPEPTPSWEPPPWPEGCPEPGVYKDVPYAEYEG
jgi:hypothetical protein